MNYVILDLEFNQPFDFDSKEKTSINFSIPFEIIQIGAVKLNPSLEVLDKFESLVKPNLYKRMHPHVQKITGITYKDLINKKPFRDVFLTFLQFVGDPANYKLCTWGNNDLKILYNNAKYYNLDLATLPSFSIDVQAITSIFLNTSQKAIGLQKAANSLNILTTLPFHGALNDAIYTAKILKIVGIDDRFDEQFENHLKLKTKSTDYELLFKIVEKKYGKPLNIKEQDMVKRAYNMGRTKLFDI